MFKWQNAITRLTTWGLGLLTGLSPAYAATLFDGQALEDGEILTWTSPFKGTVKVKAEVTTQTQTGFSETEYNKTIEVDWGTEIVLETILSDEDPTLDFDFVTDIQTKISVDPGLFFLGTEENHYERVVLVNEGDNKVYESSFFGGVQKQHTLESIFNAQGDDGKPLFVAREY